VLRIPPSLYTLLESSAARADLSLNEYCSRKLADPCVVETPCFEGVERAIEQLGEGLVGIVRFGFWARNELTEQSDVDLLLVVDPAVLIVRGLYRA
jgi:hypothetical protein